MEVEGQSEGKRLVEVKMAGIQRHGSGPGTCSLEVVLAGGRRIEVRQDFDAETLARLIQLIEQVLNRLRGDRHLIRSYDCEPVGLDDLLAGSRVVFVFASVTNENQGFLGEREFASRLRSMPAGTR